jgi:hypothetical protein
MEFYQTASLIDKGVVRARESLIIAAMTPSR